MTRRFLGTLYVLYAENERTPTSHRKNPTITTATTARTNIAAML
jgi:hypothetical protein